MNFKVRMSYNNRLLFVTGNGEVKQTKYIEVANYGDNYLLAKDSDNGLLTILDLDGNEIMSDTYVVHRFQNGLLLTYSFFEKKYISSDSISYNVNYNIYKILNFDTGKSTLVNVIQSENLLKPAQTKIFQDKLRTQTIKDFLNKPIFCFKDFIFSEVFDYRYMIVGNYSEFTLKGSTCSAFDFDLYKEKKIWRIVDITRTTKSEGDTIDLKNSKNTTFKEAELQLLDLIYTPEKPEVEDFTEQALYNDIMAEFNMYNSWKRKSKWQLMLSKILN